MSPAQPLGAQVSGRSTSSSRSAFWNLVGAGLFGFMINPPIALYYMQGLNTTPLHGHAPVRRLRHARHRPDAGLPASAAGPTASGRTARSSSRSGR